MGADLHHRVHPKLRQRLHAGAERDRLAGLPAPVRRVKHRARRHRLAGPVAHQGDRRRCETDSPARSSSHDRYRPASYTEKFGAGAAVLNALGESCYEGLKLLHALAAKAESLAPEAMDAAADGTTYEGPRGRATMHERHVSKDIYLAEAAGAEFRVVETFPGVGAGSNCA